MDNWCEGCRFHTYPYETKIPISQRGKFPIKVFRSDEDIWDVIKLLITETKEINDGGKSFDIPSSISQQLPHFCCINIMLDRQAQKDISQYLYCKEFGVIPFPGDYGMQPQRWINKVNIIKVAMTKREERMHKKAQREVEINKGINNG